MNFKSLTDDELHLNTKNLVQKERELLTEILRLLAEIESRRLFSVYKCSSLFDYCVRILGYSESAAQRRISAMRLIREIPEVEEKIESGSLSLTHLSQAQSFFVSRPFSTSFKMFRTLYSRFNDIGGVDGFTVIKQKVEYI